MRFIVRMACFIPWVLSPLLSQSAIQSQPLGAGLFVLWGGGGNVCALLGPEGSLIVDSQMSQATEKLQTARDRLTPLIHQGKSVEEIIALKPLEGLVERMPTSLPVEIFIRCVHLEISRSLK